VGRIETKGDEVEYIYLGHSCNQDCLFCATGGQKAAREVGDYTTAEIIQKISDSSKNRLVFNGGEITIRDDFPYLVNYAADRGFKEMSIMSNGVKLADFGFTKQIVESGIYRIAVCVYAHNEELYSQLTRREGHFEQMVQGIHNLFTIRDQLDYPLFIELKLLVTKQTAPHLKQIMEFILDEFPEPDDLRVHGLALAGSAKRNLDQVFVPLSQVKDEINQVVDIGRNSVSNFHIMHIPPCILGREELIQYSTLYETSKIDIHEKGRGKVSLDRGVRNRAGKADKCRDCKLYRSCLGVWHSYGEYTNWEELEPF